MPKNPSDGQGRISKKIKMLVEEEGLSQEHAVGKAFGMARSGDLGEAAKKTARRS